jgi:uncharacterized membrane protein
MELITHFRHARNLSNAERWASAIGGGVLAVLGLERRSQGGVPLALIGGELIRRGVTGHSFLYEALGFRTAPLGQGASTSVPYELGIRVDESVTVAKPRAEVFSFWRNLENLPRFFRHLESVRVEGNLSYWEAKAPTGKRMRWSATVHNETPLERIAWRSLPGSDVENAGSVLFRDRPDGRGTEVRIELQYNPPGGAVAAVLASLFGAEPSQQIREDLWRFKQLAEDSEARWQAGLRDRVEEASEESFPASDAPAFITG